MAKKAKTARPTKKAARSPVKSTVKKRSLNAKPGAAKSAGDPFNDQDAQRRLGNFESAGEHARVGGRTSGIVGQTKQRFKTDKRKTK
jgi:hypothetical protein